MKIMDQFRVVDHYFSETPESLYYQDKERMKFEAELLVSVDKEEIEQSVLELPRKETA